MPLDPFAGRPGFRYIPDPLGRFGFGRYVAERDLPDPFGRVMAPTRPEPEGPPLDPRRETVRHIVAQLLSRQGRGYESLPFDRTDRRPPQKNFAGEADINRNVGDGGASNDAPGGNGADNPPAA